MTLILRISFSSVFFFKGLLIPSSNIVNMCLYLSSGDKQEDYLGILFPYTSICRQASKTRITALFNDKTTFIDSSKIPIFEWSGISFRYDNAENKNIKGILVNEARGNFG